jgi:hypothetical protein
LLTTLSDNTLRFKSLVKGIEFCYKLSVQKVKVGVYGRDKLIIKSRDQLLFQLVIIILQRSHNSYKLGIKYVKETIQTLA